MFEFTDKSKISTKCGPMCSPFMAAVLLPLAKAPQIFVGKAKKFSLVESFYFTRPESNDPFLMIRAKNKILPGMSFTVEYDGRFIGSIVPKIKGIGGLYFDNLLSFEDTSGQSIAILSSPNIKQQLKGTLAGATAEYNLMRHSKKLGTLSLTCGIIECRASINVSKQMIDCFNPWLLVAGMGLLVKRLGESGD